MPGTPGRGNRIFPEAAYMTPPRVVEDPYRTPPPAPEQLRYRPTPVGLGQVAQNLFNPGGGSPERAMFPPLVLVMAAAAPGAQPVDPVAAAPGGSPPVPAQAVAVFGPPAVRRVRLGAGGPRQDLADALEAAAL